MADLARAAMINRVLEFLGVKAATQGANSGDVEMVGEVLDSAHERLRKYGLAPFETSSIPPWAQIPFRDYVAGDVAQSFGITGQRLLEFRQAQQVGERELAKQVAGFRHAMPIVADYF